MNRKQVEKRATKLEADLRADGLWEKLDGLFVAVSDFVIIKKGNHLTVKRGKDWLKD